MVPPDCVMEDMKSFGLSHEDEQVRNQLGMKIKGPTG